MQTSFRFLAPFPELTEFPTRLAVFQAAIHGRLEDGRSLSVRRSAILADSYRQLHTLPPKEWLRRIRVHFQGEEGVDAGGLLREWYTTLVRDLFNPGYGMFELSANGGSVQPRADFNSVQPALTLDYFTFAGRVVARAIIDGLTVSAHLTTGVLRHLLRYRVSLRDLEAVSEERHTSLQWILANDPEDAGLTFVVGVEDGLDDHREIALKPGGSDITVTQQNKVEYIQLSVDFWLTKHIKAPLDAFCDGFHSLIPVEELRRFTPGELDLLICGVPEIKVEDLRRSTQYLRPFTDSHPTIQMFWSVVGRMNGETLAKLLMFVTGSSQVPAAGFSGLAKPFTIGPAQGKGGLPCAHTCWNQIDMPLFRNERELEKKLRWAIEECSTFGFS
jgi:E3 ubiquitin-protein ligase HUWE1